MFKYKFSIFTPTYNSEKIIKRLFDSLQAQTYTNFEWIVLDDCSKDNTREFVEELIKTAKFPVKFLKNETNQMVSKGHEIGLAQVEGEFFIKISHDDLFLPTALETYLRIWETLTPEQQSKMAGVICNCVDKDGVPEGTPFPASPWIGDDFQMRFKHRVQGEKCSAIRTEVIKKYPFYYPDVDVYVPADVHFFAVSFDHQIIYSNECAIVHVVNDGLHTHLEAQMGRGKKYTKGIAFYFENLVNRFHSKIWTYDKKTYFIYMTNFVRYNRYSGESYTNIIKKVTAHKWLVYPAIVLGNANELVKYKTFL